MAQHSGQLMSAGHKRLGTLLMEISMAMRTAPNLSGNALHMDFDDVSKGVQSCLKNSGNAFAVSFLRFTMDS